MSGKAPPRVAANIDSMQRVCFTLQVRQDRIEEYKERHRQVWPDMKEALRESGWKNYSLFLRGDGLLVGYLETEDFERAQREMETKHVNSRWQREMKAFFEGAIDLDKEGQLGLLEEVFYQP